MPYRLKAGENIPQNIRRIVCEEIDFAVEQLNGKKVAKKRDEAVHEARKSIKKVRGVLKLLRPELGSAYREQNSRLRDLGAKLSELRDAGAIIETFDGIVKDASPKNGFPTIRRALEQNKKDKEQSENILAVMAATASNLAAVKGQVDQWPIPDKGFPSIRQGLRNTYRLGRRAMHQAQTKNRPELFHEWRKRAKEYWYHVRLLESCWTDVLTARENSLHDLETWLGDDHNIVVLLEQLQRQPERYGTAQDVDLFASLAQARQRELREQAISLGERLYEEKSKPFSKRIEGLWDAWQDQPDSMKERNKRERQPEKPSPSSPKKTAA